MDKRLLRMWSNFGLVKARTRRFMRFATGFVLLLSQVVQASPSAHPLAFGHLQWDPRSKVLAGTISFARTVSHSGDQSTDFDEFWLLPNRDLAGSPERKKPMSRDQREFGTVAGDVEWPLDDTGLGALVIRGVAVSELPRLCPTRAEDASKLLKNLSLTSATFEFTDSERVLRIVHESNKGLAVAQSCRIIQMSFTFHPRLGNGNFAQRIDGGATFSGPVFPIWKRAQTETYLTLSSVDERQAARCANCQPLSAGSYGLAFFGLPPPIHFEAPQDDEALVLRNFSPTEPVQSNPLLSDSRELRQTLEIFRETAAGALKVQQQNMISPWQLRLTRGHVIEQLLTEQVDEIQLNSSFGLVTPLLSHYHRAALFRALSRSFLRHQLSSSSSGTSWQQRASDETVARILAEFWLRQSFPDLSKLKKLADQFSFLPFFRAVQQGNAFVNNAVFVGAEESPTRLDYGIFDDFFSPMKGADLLKRVEACADEDSRRELGKASTEVLAGRVSAREFASRLAKMKPQSDCPVPFEVGLIPARTRQERIEIIEAEKRQNQLQILRELLPASPTAEFLFDGSSAAVQESLRVELVRENQTQESLVVAPSGQMETVVDLPTGLEKARVLQPHRAITGDRLNYPRPIRSVLQALSVNYDSRKKDVIVRSQAQFTQTGDEWGRALSIGWRREELGNYLDLQVATRIPSLLRETQSLIQLSSSTRMVEAPPSFLSVSYSIEQGTGSVLYPNGLGLRIWLRRPLTLSAFSEVMRDPEQEWLVSSSVALAPRLTWTQTLSYGRSESGVDAGLRSVPGWPAEAFISREYALIRSEIRRTLAQNLNASIARSVLFQHAILYAAHSVAFDDVQAAQRGAVDARTAQSLLMGVRLLGALFGARDQALGFEVARALTSEPRTSFGFTLGKSMN